MRRDIALLCALSAAAACAAPSGAAGASGSPTGGAASGGEAGSTSSSGGTLAATPSALLGRTARFRGSFPHLRRGAGVVIERLAPSGAWERIATATVGADGAFLARWRTDHIGHFAVRALPARARSDARAAAAAPTAAVTVYRASKATWYGPGFYGRRTACGIELTKSLLGVAHRRLPCGTPVALHYRRRSIVVPVVDRGPFANGASWDLTWATAQALGFTATDTIGALSLRGRAPLPPPPLPAPADPSGGTGAPSR